MQHHHKNNTTQHNTQLNKQQQQQQQQQKIEHKVYAAFGKSIKIFKQKQKQKHFRQIKYRDVCTYDSTYERTYRLS